MFCPNCNKDIDDDALFCPDCGTNLKKPDETISQDKPIEEITPEPVKKKFSFKDHKAKLFTIIT